MPFLKKKSEWDLEMMLEIVNLPFKGFHIAGVLLGDNKLLGVYHLFRVRQPCGGYIVAK